MDTALTIKNVTVIDWVIIALCSGFAAAVFNQIAGGVLARFQRSSDQRHQQALQEGQQAFQSNMERDKRENESLQLLIRAHFDQRDRLLEQATDSCNWIAYEMTKAHGLDYEVYDYNEPSPKFKGLTEVLGALRVIAQTHPTRSVRRLAGELQQKISTHFSSITEHGEHGELIVGGTPTVDQFSDWFGRCESLIELMHTPPTLDDVRGPGNTAVSD